MEMEVRPKFDPGDRRSNAANKEPRPRPFVFRTRSRFKVPRVQRRDFAKHFGTLGLSLGFRTHRSMWVKSCLGVSNGDLDLDAGLDGDGSDLLHDVGGGVQVDQALVDAHLPSVEGVGALTVGGLSDAEAEDLGGETDGAGDLQLLLAGTGDEVSADFLQALQVPAGEGDAD
eukprot:CAMPEP_0195039870 /NCGR_PEP_ID=MMETSP0326_2-20130528/80036_1 /TAXON_ID=2866 ORGANISM="Crypthecodinium cohnii, Strain Seligo" /NCGR_SAMPLE_ID=MMETSP0326_2 /ASSEMBLY_ACC=CAM_ASM_000348 /LENGTH=171 /DNA_ID=CAMNT_0040066761 /DNA_START=303 /DNA_END=815 /DNA_ORIENTATION=-